MEEFETLVDSHYQGLFRFGLSLTKDPDRAADLVQQVFCTWAEKGHQLVDRSKAKSWLFTTLYREFLGEARRARRFPEEDIEAARHAALGAETFDQERHLDGQRAIELLGGLEESFRAPLTLFYLQQHSYKEIAGILDVPIGTVMSRISRGKEQLRRRMTGEAEAGASKILKFQPDMFRESHG